MIGKRTLVVSGLVAVLAVPGGMALAASGVDPSPGPGSGSGQGYGPGRMMGGYGDPEDCPLHDSAAAQQWRDQREQRQQLSVEERQKVVQEHRAQMQKLMDATTRTS